ncbi:MAG: flagellar export protein FliJ [Bauldia sp.]|nr:flagellar export protein FliJ [Bauldia sp.]MCW5718880.1 flagellar export protein FliJ [Bauldia sp.]
MKSRDSVVRLKRFQVEEKRRQVAQIDGMVAEFVRMSTELDNQIRAEEERTGIHDIGHFAYSTFAKAAMQRRDNLRASADELRAQRDVAHDGLALAEEELEKLEAIAERDHERDRIDEDPAMPGATGGRRAAG